MDEVRQMKIKVGTILLPVFAFFIKNPYSLSE